MIKILEYLENQEIKHQLIFYALKIMTFGKDNIYALKVMTFGKDNIYRWMAHP